MPPSCLLKPHTLWDLRKLQVLGFSAQQALHHAGLLQQRKAHRHAVLSHQP